MFFIISPHLRNKKMRPCCFLISLSLILTGCATQKLEQGLPYFKGKNINYAISYLGIPDSEQSIAGRKVYTWGTQQSGSYLMPVTNYSNVNAFGSGGYATAYGSSTSYVPQFYNYNCEIKLATVKNVITDISYEGNEGGCNTYSKSMDKVIQDNKPSPNSQKP